MATTGGPGDRLDRRALNRATLARQLPLERVELPVTETVGRVAAVWRLVTVRRHGRPRPRRQGGVGEGRRPPSARHGGRQFSRQSEPTGAISAS